MVERSKLLGAPAFAIEADEGTAGATLEVGVFDVFLEGELEDAGGTAGTLATAAATSAPLAGSDALVLLKGEEGVEEAVEHLVCDAGLDFVVEGGEGEVEGGLEDGKGGGEVVGAVGKDEGAAVDVAEGEVEGGGGERGRGQGELAGLWDGPGDEGVVEVGAAGDEDEAVGGEDGGGVVLGGGEGDADVGVEAGAPHVDEVLAELVDAEIVGVCVVGLFVGLCRVEEELEGLAKALAGVEILELVGKEGGVDRGGDAEEGSGGGGGGGRGGPQRRGAAGDGGGGVEGHGGGRRGKGLAEGEVAGLEARRGAGVDDAWRAGP